CSPTTAWGGPWPAVAMRGGLREPWRTAPARQGPPYESVAWRGGIRKSPCTASAGRGPPYTVAAGVCHAWGMAIRIERFRGAAVRPHLEALAGLRIAVFREWPYLYQGDLDYEAGYLAAYAKSAGSVFVLAFDGDQVVGAATGIPMADETEAFLKPVRERGIAPERMFYFGESVLLPAYRGQGIGNRFFDGREA